MITSPDHGMTDRDSQREQIARLLLTYLEQLPMRTEKRLELALETLRDLPFEATPSQALTALCSRLPEQNHEAFPPGHPSIARGHMPAQYLGRARTGVRNFALQWGWVLIVSLLLVLTLLLHISK